MAKPPIGAIRIKTGDINKDLLYRGQKGSYLNCAFWENADGVDQYGFHGFITQDVSKEQREQGIKGPIIGNWKWRDEQGYQGGVQQPQQHQQQQSPPQQETQQHLDEEEDDIPF